MKQLTQKLLALLVCILVCHSSGWAFTVDGITYNIISDTDLTCEVKSSNPKYTGTVVIPSSVNYDGKVYSVTSIGKQAFQWCSGLTSVNIPSSVTSIGEEAFMWCSGLTSVNIPSSVTSIGGDAFFNCSSLTSVYIEDLSAWCKIDFGFYTSNPLNEAHRLYLNGILVEDLNIPDDVTSIEGVAFYGCSSLTSVNIPSSVTAIGSGAFSGCSGLTSVNIPSSVTAIGSSAFSGCSSLTSVNIPSSVTAISNFVFQYCSSLTSVNIPNGVTSIGMWAFEKCI